MAERQFTITVDEDTRMYCLDHEKFYVECFRCAYALGMSIEKIEEIEP